MQGESSSLSLRLSFFLSLLTALPPTLQYKLRRTSLIPLISLQTLRDLLPQTSPQGEKAKMGRCMHRSSIVSKHPILFCPLFLQPRKANCKLYRVFTEDSQCVQLLFSYKMFCYLDSVKSCPFSYIVRHNPHIYTIL